MGFENTAGLGVLNSYGPRKTEEKFGGQTSKSDGIVKSAIWQFEYNTLPNHTGAAVSIPTGNLSQKIPAGATIVSAKLIVDTAFTSTSTTTDLVVGLYTGTGTGTVVDADGLLTAAHCSQTTIAVAGAVLDGASGTPGALIGQTVGATAVSVVVAPTSNDLLTGAARLVVEFIYDR